MKSAERQPPVSAPVPAGISPRRRRCRRMRRQTCRRCGRIRRRRR
jgi:hypothetical protein